MVTESAAKRLYTIYGMNASEERVAISTLLSRGFGPTRGYNNQRNVTGLGTRGHAGGIEHESGR